MARPFLYKFNLLIRRSCHGNFFRLWIRWRRILAAAHSAPAAVVAFDFGQQVHDVSGSRYVFGEDGGVAAGVVAFIADDSGQN